MSTPPYPRVPTASTSVVTCQSKERFTSPTIAKARAKRSQRVYRCRVCKQYHFTSKGYE